MANVKRYQDLTFTDDFMFCKVLENDADLCRRLLELVLDLEISEVRFKNKQQVIEPNPEKKSIRLDILLNDENNTIFDIEMQTHHRKELPRRTRGYQGVMDIDALGRGAQFKTLPDSYIVFICTFDPFLQGLHKYTFREMCEENPSILLGDGTCKVFVNARSEEQDVSLEMRAFLDYLCGREAASGLTSDIEERINFAKNNKVWEMEYMQFMDYWSDVADDAREEGLEEGREEGRKEGRKQGRKEGREEGLLEGEARFAALVQKMMELGRSDDVARAATDVEYRKQLYSEFGIEQKL